MGTCIAEYLHRFFSLYRFLTCYLFTLIYPENGLFFSSSFLTYYCFYLIFLRTLRSFFLLKKSLSPMLSSFIFLLFQLMVKALQVLKLLQRLYLDAREGGPQIIGLRLQGS